MIYFSFKALKNSFDCKCGHIIFFIKREKSRVRKALFLFHTVQEGTCSDLKWRACSQLWYQRQRGGLLACRPPHHHTESWTLIPYANSMQHTSWQGCIGPSPKHLPYFPPRAQISAEFCSWCPIVTIGPELLELRNVWTTFSDTGFGFGWCSVESLILVGPF